MSFAAIFTLVLFRVTGDAFCYSGHAHKLYPRQVPCFVLFVIYSAYSAFAAVNAPLLSSSSAVTGSGVFLY